MATLAEKQAELNLLRKRDELTSLRAEQSQPKPEEQSLGMNLLDVAARPVTRAAEALGVPKGPSASDLGVPGYVDQQVQKPEPKPRMFMSGEGPREMMVPMPEAQPLKHGPLDPTVGGVATGIGDLLFPWGKALKVLGGIPRGAIGALTNLSPRAAQTFAESSSAVNKLAPLIKEGNLAPIEKQAEQLHGQVMRALPAKGVENAAKIRELAQGQTVPTDIETLQVLAKAGDEKSAKMLQDITGGSVDVSRAEASQMPLEEAYRQRQAAGDLAGYRKDPNTGLPNARYGEMSAAQMRLRDLMTSIPGLGEKLKALSDESYSGIKMQNKLKSVQPLNLVKSETYAPRLQRLAQDQGMPDLLNMNRQYQAANELSKQPGMWDAIRDANIKQPLKSASAVVAPLARKLLPLTEKIKKAADAAEPYSVWGSLKSNIGDQ